MAGRIRREDVDEVRARVRIEDVVGEYVTLRQAGVGSLKGLCPFHEERSPSFNVRPQVGRYHCFGCGEGGDVLDFVMAMDHISFAEAVERLAASCGVTLRYEDGSGPDRAQTGRRQRLLDANAAAETFFREQLVTPAARLGQEFLAGRHFDRDAADRFAVGYAPNSWDATLRHLRGRGFTDDELTAAGLASTGRRGPIDRFRGRLMWPIRDLTGATVGFGARRLEDEDNGPKYLNTPQTPIYNKSAVLYGVDLAKRDIVKDRQVVIVEGYTDVMAMHLSGVGTAVATCGTAFGAEHIRIVRRLIVDDDTRASSIVFTFDGDEAGRKAALKAFEEDQRFVAQTFVAVDPAGKDPCELWIDGGSDAVAGLIERREPMFEFAIRATLAGLDLDRPEARVQGLRAAAPVVARIKDPALRPLYVRWLAGTLGLDLDTVGRAVDGNHQSRPTTSRAAGRSGQVDAAGQRATTQAAQAGTAPPGASGVGTEAPTEVRRPDPRDPVVATERQLLQLLLQYPELVPAEAFARFAAEDVATPAYRVITEAVVALGGPSAAGRDWFDRIQEGTPQPVRFLLNELAVDPLPERRPEHLTPLALGVVRQIRSRGLQRQLAALYSQLQRAESVGDEAAVATVNRQLMELQRELHGLRSGG